MNFPRYLLLLPFWFALYWLLLWPIGIVGAISAILFAPLIACFVDKDGNLPYLLRKLYQPIDNPCWGDASWAVEHPTWDLYTLAETYLQRNAFYGYLSLVGCPRPLRVKAFGTVDIQDGANGKAGWYFIIGSNGTFEFCWVKNLGNGRCARGEYGWSLRPYAMGYTSKLAGSLQLVLLCRFMDFQQKQ